MLAKDVRCGNIIKFIFSFAGCTSLVYSWEQGTSGIIQPSRRVHACGEMHSDLLNIRIMILHIFSHHSPLHFTQHPINTPTQPQCCESAKQPACSAHQSGEWKESRKCKNSHGFRPSGFIHSTSICGFNAFIHDILSVKRVVWCYRYTYLQGGNLLKMYELIVALPSTMVCRHCWRATVSRYPLTTPYLPLWIVHTAQDILIKNKPARVHHTESVAFSWSFSQCSTKLSQHQAVWSQ